jgi:hypothetical protein
MRLKRILLPEDSIELKEKARKALGLNGFVKPEYDLKYDSMLRAASLFKIKPTIMIRRIMPPKVKVTKDNNYWAREVHKQIGENRV